MAGQKLRVAGRTYADGKPKPYFRGVLHGCVAILLLPLLLGTRRWPVVMLFAGKLFNYSASAVFHLYPFKTTQAVQTALKIDLISISVSIWACTSPYARTREEWIVTFLLGLAFTVATAIAVHIQFQGHVGLATPTNRSEMPRTMLVVTQIIGTIAYVYWRLQRLRPLLACFGVPCYVTALLISVPVTAAHKEEPMSERVPWHQRGRNGFHEDFHVMLFLADAALAYLGVFASP